VVLNGEDVSPSDPDEVVPVPDAEISVVAEVDVTYGPSGSVDELVSPRLALLDVVNWSPFCWTQAVMVTAKTAMGRLESSMESPGVRS
jgi:hypothetical protein